jgi:hypothetical protein
VVVPPRTRHRAVDEFLHSRQHWLADKLAALQVLAQRPRALPHRPGQVWLAGEPVPVVHTPAGRSVTAMDGGRVVISGAPSDAAASVGRWYRREARRRLTETTDRLAPGLNVTVTAVSVRDQRTRWGSCSHDGRLSFSWRLVLAPSPVLDYVVLHELCHLREFNHSPAFWKLVESVRPDWRDAVGWLREHGHELRSYRPEQWLAIDPVTTGVAPSAAGSVHDHDHDHDHDHAACR